MTYLAYVRTAPRLRFRVYDPARRLYPASLRLAPRFRVEELPALRAALERFTAEFPAAAWQIRTADGLRVVAAAG
ncbi:MAG: hypothetical protein LUG45_05255 [Clostridiales bacterium]|nr:hypothetical protein [Clostridiales bacterium]